jgi:hypothetical protein
MGKLLPLTAIVIVVSTLGSHTASAFHVVCKMLDTFQPLSTCQQMCDQTKLADWINPGSTSQEGGWLTWDRINYPHNVTERPYKITSCKATPSPEFAGACRVTICGPVLGPEDPKRSRASRKVSTPIPAPKIGPPLPGLLESDVGGVRQGPSVTGTPSAPAAAPIFRSR